MTNRPSPRHASRITMRSERFSTDVMSTRYAKLAAINVASPPLTPSATQPTNSTDSGRRNQMTRKKFTTLIIMPTSGSRMAILRPALSLYDASMSVEKKAGTKELLFRYINHKDVADCMCFSIMYALLLSLTTVQFSA